MALATLGRTFAKARNARILPSRFCADRNPSEPARFLNIPRIVCRQNRAVSANQARRFPRQASIGQRAERVAAIRRRISSEATGSRVRSAADCRF